jgi:hypothetical protein
VKHRITFELTDEQLKTARFLTNNESWHGSILNPIKQAIRDYQPPVEPLRVGDEVGSISKILYVDSMCVLISLAEDDRDYWTRAEYPDGLLVDRDGKTVLAPWPEVTE